MHIIAVDFNAVLIAPLLAFLTNAVVDNENAIVAQSANDGFGDGTACRYLTDAGQPTDGGNNVS